MTKQAKKARRPMAGLALLLAASLGFAGCGQPRSGSAAPGSQGAASQGQAAGAATIKIVMDNTSTDQYTQLFQTIADELGITIDLVVAPGNYEQFLQTQLQSSEKPDLFKLNGQYLTSFVKDGLATDLNAYFTGAWKTQLEDWDLLTKGTFDQCRRAKDNPVQRSSDSTDPLWAIPFDSGCQSFGINRGAIQNTPTLSAKVEALVSSGAIPCKPWEVGMDGQVEAYTYSEFAALLEGLQEVIDAGGLAGPAENLKYALQGGDALKLLTYSAGGSFLNSSFDTVTLANDGVVQAAFFLKDGMNKGYIDPMSDGGEGWNNWVSGMYLFDANTGTWENGTYLENGMDVPMMPIPVPDGADRSKWVSGQTGSCMVLRSGSPNEETAARVMGAFLSRSSEAFQLENAMNVPMYDDSWDAYINENDAGSGVYPYDANCKNVYNRIISGKNGQVQETYYTVGRTWWNTFMTNYTNSFCLDGSIVTQEDVFNWMLVQQPQIQALLEAGT